MFNDTLAQTKIIGYCVSDNGKCMKDEIKQLIKNSNGYKTVYRALQK